MLRKLIETISTLADSEAIHSGDFRKAAVEINENIARVLNVSRTCTWIFDNNQSCIQYVDIYELCSGSHIDHAEYCPSDFLNFLIPLEKQQVFNKKDFSENTQAIEPLRDYTDLHDITSILLTPIISEGRTAGVISLEYNTSRKHKILSAEEKAFIQILSELLALTLETENRINTEKLLSSSAIQYKTVVDFLNDAIHTVDRDLNIVLFNKKVEEWEKNYNLPAVYHGINLRDLCPFLSETVFDEYNHVFKEGKTLITNESCILIDGLEHYRETWKIPVIENGRTVRVVTVIRDIAKEFLAKKIEASLYRISSAAISTPDLDELIQKIGDVVTDLFPAASFLIALQDPETDRISFPFFCNNIDPPPKPGKPGKGLAEYVLRTGKAVCIDSRMYERLINENKVEKFTEDFREWVGVPLVIKKGSIGVLALQSNKLGLHLTDRHKEILEIISNQVAVAIDLKKTLVSLKESEEKYRNLVEMANDGIVIIQDSTVVFTNRKLSETLGYKINEMIGLEFSHFLDKPDNKTIMATGRMKQYKRTSPSVFETIMKKKDGTPVFVELNTGEIIYSGRKAELVIIRNVTERRRSEEEKERLKEQILHAQKLESLGVLAGGIAHDFNNLLMGVLGNACLVLDEFPEGSSGYKIIKRIETASLRAADLTNQLLAYSGKGMFVVEPVDITKLVQEMMHLLKASISKSVILHFSSSGICPVVQADATQIRQVVMNFIINASEAIGDNTGIISVSTGTIDANRNYLNKTYFDNDLPEGVYAFLEVSDTGCGMDEKTQLRIFEPFFTTKFSGRGLGLAAAVGIIRGHNGAIKVYSVQGEGTTFRILLPVIGSPEEILEPREEDLFEWTYGGLVLFVDDEEEVREVGKLILEKHGFSVILASDGQEAVEIFKERSSEIQAVVLDMTMPRLNGYDTFTVMKRIKPGIRVILCSGYNEQETLRVFNSMKPSGFIQKPYKASDLIRKLSSFFRHDSRLGE